MERIHFNKKIISVYLVWAVIVIISCLLNFGKADTFQNILFNFSAPLLFLFVGLSVQGIRPWLKYGSLIIGSLYFVYIALYYLIGFHNHYWGN